VNATQLLKTDHAKVKKLFRDFARTTPRAVKTRQRLVDQVATELDVHARIEEEIFYPAVETVQALRVLVEESRKEHQEVKQRVAEIQGMRVDDEALPRRMRELQKAVVHHASDEEEQKMFPQVQAAFSREELDELGRRLQERKQALLTGTVARLARSMKKVFGKVA
jgi:hemerythrin superfamily protein